MPSETVAQFWSNEQTDKCESGGGDEVRKKKAKVVLPLMSLVVGKIR